MATLAPKVNGWERLLASLTAPRENSTDTSPVKPPETPKAPNAPKKPKTSSPKKQGS